MLDPRKWVDLSHNVGPRIWVVSSCALSLSPLSLSISLSLSRSLCLSVSSLSFVSLPPSLLLSFSWYFIISLILSVFSFETFCFVFLSFFLSFFLCFSLSFILSLLVHSFIV